MFIAPRNTRGMTKRRYSSRRSSGMFEAAS
jgi:hypothetical protein